MIFTNKDKKDLTRDQLLEEIKKKMTMINELSKQRQELFDLQNNNDKISRQILEFLKALKTIDDKICDKCGQKLPEDYDEYESRYT